MYEKHLHIITHELPYPPAHGGLVDLYYKLVYLHKMGIKIHLHGYTTNGKTAPELNEFCEEINYYKRVKGPQRFSLKIPYIVQSRNDSRLYTNLIKDSYPVLFEGIHTTRLLTKNKLAGRTCFIRLHNIEYLYYGQLKKYESNFFKRMYYGLESRLLKKYEASLKGKATYFAVNQRDAELYSAIFGIRDICFLPVFNPFTIIKTLPGTGTYCLYHGNLGINENEAAVAWMIKNIFSHLDLPFIVAGKDPSQRLIQLARRYKNCSLVVNPANALMQELIRDAQVHILPSFNATGVKLKLLNAICNGRHCLVNEAAVAGSGLEPFCHQAETAATFIEKLTFLHREVMTPEEIEKRKKLLSGTYNNEANALKMVTWLY